MAKGKPKPFWKKNPELERIGRHIGKFVDNLDANGLLNLVAGLTCAYGGYEAARKFGGSLEANLGSAGTAVLAFQLAKSENLVVGASGLAYLAALGLVNVYNPALGAAKYVAQRSIEKSKELPFPFGWGLEVDWPPKIALGT